MIPLYRVDSVIFPADAFHQAFTAFVRGCANGEAAYPTQVLSLLQGRTVSNMEQAQKLINEVQTRNKVHLQPRQQTTPTPPRFRIDKHAGTIYWDCLQKKGAEPGRKATQLVFELQTDGIKIRVHGSDADSIGRRMNAVLGKEVSTAYQAAISSA